MEAVYNDIFGNEWPYDNFTDSLYPEDIITPYKNLPFAICYFLLSLVGLVGNSLVMYIFLRYAKVRTVSNIYIFNLAIGDVLQMLVLLFLATQEATNNWPFGIFWCKFVMSVEFINPTAGITFVTVMSIDRCVVLYRPLLASKWRKPKVATLLSIAVWVFSILAALHVTFFASAHEDHPICSFVRPNRGHLYLFTLCHFCLGFLQPLELCALCLCMTAVKPPPAVPPVKASMCKGSDRTRMVVMLFVIHMILWLPVYIFNLIVLQPYVPLELIMGHRVLINGGSAVKALSTIKSCIYPVIYWYLAGEFRQYFQRVLCCKKRTLTVSSDVVGYKEESMSEVRGTQQIDPVDRMQPIQW